MPACPTGAQLEALIRERHRAEPNYVGSTYVALQGERGQGWAGMVYVFALVGHGLPEPSAGSYQASR